MRARTLRRSQLAACPKGSLSPRHFKDDGTCRCSERQAILTEIARTEAELRVLRERLRGLREDLSNT